MGQLGWKWTNASCGCEYDCYCWRDELLRDGPQEYTGLGKKWEILSGNLQLEPDVVGPRHHIKATESNSIAIYQQDAPGCLFHSGLNYNFPEHTTNTDQARLYYGWQDENNHVYAEFIFGGYTTGPWGMWMKLYDGIIRIVQVSGGTESVLSEATGLLLGQGSGIAWQYAIVQEPHSGRILVGTITWHSTVGIDTDYYFEFVSWAYTPQGVVLPGSRCGVGVGTIAEGNTVDFYTWNTNDVAIAAMEIRQGGEWQTHMGTDNCVKLFPCGTGVERLGYALRSPYPWDVPDEISITTSGFLPQNWWEHCDSCSDTEGTFVLTAQNPCTWTYNFDPRIECYTASSGGYPEIGHRPLVWGNYSANLWTDDGITANLTVSLNTEPQRSTFGGCGSWVFTGLDPQNFGSWGGTATGYCGYTLYPCNYDSSTCTLNGAWNV